MIEFLSTGYPPGTEEKLPLKVTPSERHFESKPPPNPLQGTAVRMQQPGRCGQSLSSITNRGGAALEASLASLTPGKCTVTLSWCLAPVEVVIEAPKTMPGVTTVPPAFRLGISRLPGKVKQEWLVLSQSWGTEDTVNYLPHLPSAAQPCSTTIVLPESHRVPLPRAVNQEHLPSQLDY